jgi:hypothetical protein
MLSGSTSTPLAHSATGFEPIDPRTVQAWLSDRPPQGERALHRAAPGLDLYVPAEGPGSWIARIQPRGKRPDGRRWTLRVLKIGNTNTHSLTEAVALLQELQQQATRGEDLVAGSPRLIELRAEAEAAPKSPARQPERITSNTIRAWLNDRPAWGRHATHRVVPGLDLYVTAEGPGSWIARLQPRGRRPDGRRWPLRELKIGNTDTHSLAEAVSALRELQLEVTFGRDPGAERRAVVKARTETAATEAARTTCQQALDAYRRVLAGREISPSHADDEAAQVRLGLTSIKALDLPLLDLKVAHVERLLAECPAASRRARYGALNRFLRWAFRREDPTRMPPTMALDPHERPKLGKSRTRVLRPEEIAVIYNAIAALPNASTRDLLLFMVSTPSRRESETANMRWRDIDLAGKLWTQPTSKNQESHVFPLNAHALAILQRRYTFDDPPPHPNALVFPGPRDGGVFVGWSNAKTAIDKRLPFPLDPWTFHDFRRSFVTQMSTRGFDDGLLDLAINHKAARTRSRLTRTYNLHERLPERIKLLDTWGHFLEEALLRGFPDTAVAAHQPGSTARDAPASSPA